MNKSDRCLEICDIDPNTTEDIKKYFKGLREYDRFIRIGPKGYFYPETPEIRDQMTAIYNLHVRSSDVYVATFPRSGTTWMQELVWLVANDLDYNTAQSKHLIERYTTLGSYFINRDVMASQMEKFETQQLNHLNKLKRMITSPIELLENMSERRFIKCHIPLSMLPPKTLDKCKMVYVARDPRDVAVSLYHLSRLTKTFEFVGEFKTFWDFFVRGLIVRSPYFDQVKEAWAMRDHPNMLFLFYDNMTHDLPGTIRRVSQFLEKEYTEEQIKGLCEHLNFTKFSKNDSVKIDFLAEFDALVADQEPFIRKGKSGGWRDYFDDDMAKNAEKWIAENLQDTGLKFSHYI